jgi:arginase
MGAADAGTVAPSGDSAALSRAITALLDRGQLPLVLGGDCCIVIGATAPLGGRQGLAYIDGHTDFRHSANLELLPATARTELADLTGRGDTLRRFRDEDVTVIGFRRDDPAFQELRKTSIQLWPMFWLYEHSREELDKSLARRLVRDDLDGIWIHLDVDALDPVLVSAVPHPRADGLSGSELAAILRVLLASGRVTGMSIAGFLPAGDPGGRQQTIIADLLVESFSGHEAGGGA